MRLRGQNYEKKHLHCNQSIQQAGLPGYHLWADAHVVQGGSSLTFLNAVGCANKINNHAANVRSQKHEKHEKCPGHRSYILRNRARRMNCDQREEKNGFVFRPNFMIFFTSVVNCLFIESSFWMSCFSFSFDFGSHTIFFCEWLFILFAQPTALRNVRELPPCTTCASAHKWYPGRPACWIDWLQCKCFFS